MSEPAARLFDDDYPDARSVRVYPIPWVLRASVQAFYSDRIFETEAVGLENPWSGSLCLNPPYGPAVRDWIAKACHEYASGRIIEALLLLKASTDARWFGLLMSYGAVVCFIRGRLCFNDLGRDAPFASMLAYLGPRRKEFERVFGECGVIACEQPPLAERIRPFRWKWLLGRIPQWLRRCHSRCWA